MADNPFTDLFSSLPTAEDLRRWEAERERMNAAITDLVTKRENLTRMIDLARSFVEPNRLKPSASSIAEAAELKRTPSGKVVKGSWMTALANVAKAHPDGISYEEVRLQLPAAFREVLARDSNSKSFYGAMRRLEVDGHIVRHNGHIFTPAGYKKHQRAVDAGKIADVTAGGKPVSAVDPVLFAFLREHGPQRASVIRSHLITHPEFDALRRNESQLYNVLKRLKDRGEINHDEATGLYSVVGESEPSAELPLDGPQPGGVAAPPFENVVGFSRPR